MANNIYIGNRYVPIFADPVEWDNLRTYEPLTIVTYQGTSYTSKKAVPVGIALNNTEYWVVTGNYNAQIAQLTDEVSSLSDDVSGLSDDVSGISNVVSGLSDDVSQLESEVSGLSDDVSQLESEVSGLGVGSSLFIGDSYLVVENNNWATYLASMLGKTVGTDCFIKGEGNTGFQGSGTGHTGSGFARLTSEIAGTMTAEQKAGIKTIIYGGGHNDWNISDIHSGMASCKQIIDANFPNAKVYVAITDFGRVARADHARILMAEGYSTCSLYNMIYLGDCSQWIGLNPLSYLANDLWHPTQSGELVIAQALYNSLLHGQNELTYIREITEGNSNAVFKQSGDNINIDGMLFNDFQSSPAPQLTADGSTSFATMIDSTKTIFASSREVAGTGMLTIRTTGGYVTYPTVVAVQGSTITATPVIGDGNAWKTYSAGEILQTICTYSISMNIQMNQ